MGSPPGRVLRVDIDGVLVPMDVAVQAFARRVGESLPPAAAAAVIDGMRGYLEGRFAAAPDPEHDQRRGAARSGPEPAVLANVDGVAAVRWLANRAGLTAAQLAAAQGAAAQDVVDASFAIDVDEAWPAALAAFRDVGGRVLARSAFFPGPLAAELLHRLGFAGLVELDRSAEVPTGAAGVTGGPAEVAAVAAALTAPAETGPNVERIGSTGTREFPAC